MKSKLVNLGPRISNGEEQFKEFWRALWVNWIPKDESHIPLRNLMEENCCFNGGIPSMDLQASTMGFGEDGFLGREFLFWELNNERMNWIKGIRGLYSLGKSA